MAENLGGTIERDLTKIEHEVAAKREQAEKGSEPVPSDKELLHDVVRQKLQGATPPAPATGPVASPTVPVDEYLSMALTESLNKALNAVASTHNAALIDAFHDALVDRLYEEMVKRNKIATTS